MNGKTKTNLDEFDEFYKTKLKPILFKNYDNETKCIKDVIERFEKMVDYNVPHGKKLRGLCVYESFLQLLDLNESKNEKNLGNINGYDLNFLIEDAKAIGWCIEFVNLIYLYYFLL